MDLANVLARFRVVASPFWTDPKSAGPARALLGGVVALTLGTTAISVGFNFLGRDFYNAIAEKQPDDFDRLLKTYILAIAGAIPFFVARDYYQSVLTLRWRAWMTERYVEKYLSDRNFYHIQTGSVIDNPTSASSTTSRASPRRVSGWRLPCSTPASTSSVSAAS